MTLDYFIEKAAEKEREEAELEQKELERMREKAAHYLALKLSKEAWEAMGITDPENTFTSLGGNKIGVIYTHQIKFLESVLNMRVEISTNILYSENQCVLVSCRGDRLQFQYLRSTPEDNALTIGECVRKAEDQAASALAKAHEKQLKELRSKVGYSYNSLESVNNLRSLLSQFDLLTEAEKVELSAQIDALEDTTRKAIEERNRSAEQAEKAAYKAAFEVLDIGRSFLSVKKKRDAMAQECAERETKRLWTPWAARRLRYVPGRTVQFQYDEGFEYEDLEASLIRSVVVLPESLHAEFDIPDGYEAKIIPHSGEVTPIKLFALLDEEIVQFDEPDTNDSLEFHRSYGYANNEYWINVPAYIKDKPVEPPELIEMTLEMEELRRAWYKTLENGALPTKVRSILRGRDLKRHMDFTPKQIATGEGVDYPDSYDDVPF